jgi:hypothetical protein
MQEIASLLKPAAQVRSATVRDSSYIHDRDDRGNGGQIATVAKNYMRIPAFGSWSQTRQNSRISIRVPNETRM